MSLTAKFGPAFSAAQQNEMLDTISKTLVEKGISIHSFQQALLVPKEPSKVDIRCANGGSVILDMESSEHVRFIRGVLNDKTQRTRLTFAIPAPTGYPHGLVAKPASW